MRTHSVKQQQGSALVWLVSLTMIVGMLALVVEISQLYFQKRNLQTLANSLATIVVNKNQSCTDEILMPKDVQIDYSNSIKAELITANPGLESLINALVYVNIQRVLFELNEGIYEVVGLPDKALSSNGIAVDLATDMPFLLGYFNKAFGEGVELKAHAAARKEVNVVLSGFGSLASVEDGLLGSLLASLLGVESTSLTNVDDLKSLTFSLGDLLGSTPLNELKSVGLDSLLDNILGGTEVAQPLVGFINSLIDAQPDILYKSIDLTKVINVVHSTEPPEDIQMPAYDTIVALVMNILEQELSGPITLNLDLMPEQLISTDITLEIAQAPTLAVGPARKGNNNQWLTRVDYAAVDLSVDLSLSLLGIFSVPLELSVKAGGGEANLVGAVCASGSENNARFAVESYSDVLSIRINEIAEQDIGITDEELDTLLKVKLESDGPILEWSSANFEGGIEWSEILQIGSDEEYIFPEGNGLSAVSLKLPKIKIESRALANCGILNFLCDTLDALLGVVFTLLEGVVDGVDDLLGLETVLSSALETTLSDLLATLKSLLGLLGVPVGNTQVLVKSPTQYGFTVVECPTSCINN